MPYGAGPMGTDWQGSRVLITGASSGIGAGLAEEFAPRGAVPRQRAGPRRGSRPPPSSAAARRDGARAGRRPGRPRRRRPPGRRRAGRARRRRRAREQRRHPEAAQRAGPRRGHRRHGDAGELPRPDPPHARAPAPDDRARWRADRQRVVGGGDAVVPGRGRRTTRRSRPSRCSPRRWRSTSGTPASRCWWSTRGSSTPRCSRCPTTTRSPRRSSSSPSASWSRRRSTRSTAVRSRCTSPQYFKDFVTGKANNVEGFVAGTAEYMRQQQATGGE